MTCRMRRQVTFLGCTLSALLAMPALAQDTADRADRAAEQIQNRADREADRFDDRANRPADRLDDQRDRAADRLDNRGDRSLDRADDRSDRMNDRGLDRDRRHSDRWSDSDRDRAHRDGMHRDSAYSDQYSDQYSQYSGSSYSYGGTNWDRYPIAIKDERARSASHPGYVPMGPNSTRIVNPGIARGFGYGVVADSGYSGPCYAPAETSAQAWRSDDQRRMSEFREIRGEVLATRYDLRDGQERLLVRVRPEIGEQIHVIDLGPRDRLGRLNISEGDRITVFARPSRVRGESLLVAREIRAGGEVVRIDIDDAQFDDSARLRGEPVSPDWQRDAEQRRSMQERDRSSDWSDRERRDMQRDMRDRDRSLRDQERNLRDQDRNLNDQDRMDRERSQQDLRDDAGRSQDNLRDSSDRARQGAQDTADRARQSAQDAADSARQGAQDAADRARDAGTGQQQNQSDTNR